MLAACTKRASGDALPCPSSVTCIQPFGHATIAARAPSRDAQPEADAFTRRSVPGSRLLVFGASR